MDTNKPFLETYLTPIAVLVGALILAITYVYVSGSASPSPAGQPMGGTANIEEVDVSNSPFIGDEDAPVTMAVYFDYQCPFCKQFDQVVMPELISKYVEEGKLKIVFKDFQFLGADSQTAAEFSRAVWELYPEQHHAWLEAVYAAQDEEGDQGFGDLPSIQTVTQTIPGIDVAKVVTLMNEKKAEYAALIAADRAEGARMGINGTPSVIVGEKLFYAMSPTQFYAGISAEIEEQL